MHPSVPRKVIYLGHEVVVLEYLHKTHQYRIMLENGDELVVHRFNIDFLEDR